MNSNSVTTKVKKVNGKNIEQARFFEDQLFEAQRALFSATSIKQVKFLQNKIKYLRQQINKIE